MQMSGRKKATAGMAVVTTTDRHSGGGLNSSSSGELKFYLD